MGNRCSCLKSLNNEDHQVITEKEEGRSRSTIDSDAITFHPLKIIKIQSIIRGYIDRLSICSQNQTTPSTFTLPTIKSRKTDENLTFQPDFSNSLILATEKRLGAFVYPMQDPETIEVALKPATKLENNSIYLSNVIVGEY